MSLIAHYRLDGNADDALGQYGGTTQGAISWVDGKLGQAAQFDGSTGYITDSRISDYLHGKAEASISLWVKKNAIQYGFIQLSGYASTNGNLYPYDTETKVYLDVFRTDRLGPIYMPKSVLEMHHVVITQAPGVWRLYQDGELVHETSANETVSTDYQQFEIGRNSNNRYCNGIIDDVRIYDHALSKHEVRDLAKGLVFHLEATESGPKDKSLQGNAVVNNGATYVENVPVGKGGYEFVSNSIDCGNLFHTTKDQTISIWVKPSNFSARRNFYNRNYGGEGTITQETNGTLNYYWGTNGGNSTPYQGFNSVTGLILNQWNHVCLVRKLGVGGYLRWYINGVQTATATPAYAESAKSVSNLILGTGYTTFFNGVLADVRQYAEALSADDIKELYQRRASLDAQGNFYAGLINDTGIKQPLLLDYTQWEDGQVDSVGMFLRNGDLGENYRVIDTDPWGKPTVVWEARPGATSNGDGGWNSDWFSVDPTKTYRISTWVRRTVTGNGIFYMGCYGLPAVLNRSNGAANSNPYFDYRAGLGSTWILVVGHIWPIGSGAGAVHPDSGVYTVEDGRISNVGGNTGGDCVFAEGTTLARHRSYLFYSTDVNTRQQWCYPRMDICDGTEPSITELLAGFDSRNEALFRAKSGALPGQSIASSASGSYSEIGITDGLVAYYPLTKDAKDYSGDGYDGVVNGAVPVGGGFDGKGAFSFDGVNNNFIRASHEPMNPTGHTISGWFKKRSDVKTSYPIFLSYGLPYIACDGAGLPFRVSYTGGGSQTHTAGGVIPVLNEWYYVVAVFDVGGVSLFVNGEFQSINPTPCVNVSTTFDMGRHINSPTYQIDGEICNVKIFNRALSPEEIAVEYKRTGPAKMTQYNGRTYIQGQFKEVTA